MVIISTYIGILTIEFTTEWSDLLVYGEDGEDCVAPDVGVSMLQTGSYGWHQRLQQLGLLQLAEEPQSWAPQELIGMLQILSHTIIQYLITSLFQVHFVYGRFMSFRGLLQTFSIMNSICFHECSICFLDMFSRSFSIWNQILSCDQEFIKT